MVNLRGLVAVPTILMCGLVADAAAQSNARNAPKPDAKAVLEKVRETYKNVPGYHLERVLLVQEVGSDRKPANIAELTLTLATENSKPGLEGRPFPPVNLDRFRLGTKTTRGDVLQACDGRTCVSYTSLKNEYMTGNRFRDVNTSVGGSMLLALHLFTFSTLEEGAVQNATVVGEEEVKVGKELRACYVIEGQIQTTPPRPPSGGSKGPPTSSTLGAFWLVTMLTLQGMTEEGQATRYWPWPDEEAAGIAEPTRVTLWIDRNAHTVVRSTMAAQLYKRSGSMGQAVEKVTVTVTDRFTTAAVGAPPDDLFRFTPPEGAREVPNAASRRDQKK